MSSSDSPYSDHSTPPYWAGWPPVKKQRVHGAADFDNVQDEISHEELIGTLEDVKARKIVAWANWWFRPGKFLPEDEDLDDAWEKATANAVAMPETRVGLGGRPQLSPDEERVIQDVKQRYVHREPSERTWQLINSLKPGPDHN